MVVFDLLPNLHQMLLGHMLDLHQTLHNLEDCVVQQRVGQTGQQFVGNSQLKLSWRKNIQLIKTTNIPNVNTYSGSVACIFFSCSSRKYSFRCRNSWLW